MPRTLFGPDPFQMPVGVLCRRTGMIPAETSIQRAAEHFHELGVPAIPVSEEGALLGVLEEDALIHAYERGLTSGDPIRELVKHTASVISARASGAEALRFLADNQVPYLLVVDSLQVPLGIATPSRLAAAPQIAYRPRMVGGMATPAGVYLTNGSIGAGVGPWALIATGVLMFLAFVVGGLLMRAVFNFGPEEWFTASWRFPVENAGASVFFLLALRFSPLAGIHGAEHKVVHAIERGEALEPDVVKRMPRLHPRCGTNIAVGAMLFLSIQGAGFGDPELRLLLAIVVTLTLWRPLGMLMQHVVTTKEPTTAQVESAIVSGKMLLKRVQTEAESQPNILRRLAASGLFQIMAGAILVQILIWGLMTILSVPLEWRVF